MKIHVLSYICTILIADADHMGQLKDRGGTDCNDSSIKISQLKCMFLSYICTILITDADHMGQLKDRGGTDCNDGSIEITE